ncbi:hypothetical protein [Bradyrhizobium sp. AUGA SZCCT0283]|uniref:hypothetical protein n=1 Tax=Bradyrhizobium sp. AUGA SZCCT0283 TaxID=2807671 RepID=UPI001BA814D2|nr:hypothetical protein [Bradyrhizobium sp. AUGA SZCCT0283]MBR1279467.1 hypothetical protein [Bradyrhizobium sp. AUGA SZCCT0283]
MAAVLIAGLALCGCDDDKNRAFQACIKKAQADPVQTEICMDEQSYVFSTSHLCGVLYPNVGAECYSTTWRAWDGGGLRCLNPDNSKCGPMSKPYFGNCEMTHWGTEMTQVEVDQLNERVAWLERKMVRVLWLLVSIVSAFAGFVVAYTIDNSLGPGSIIIGVGIWLTVGFILQRQEFKGAPQHIQFIDP